MPFMVMPASAAALRVCSPKFAAAVDGDEPCLCHTRVDACSIAHRPGSEGCGTLAQQGTTANDPPRVSSAPAELEDGRQRQVNCGFRRQLHIFWLIAVCLGAGLRCRLDRLRRLPPTEEKSPWLSMHDAAQQPVRLDSRCQGEQRTWRLPPLPWALPAVCCHQMATVPSLAACVCLQPGWRSARPLGEHSSDL
jgi:hypothetical protein